MRLEGLMPVSMCVTVHGKDVVYMTIVRPTVIDLCCGAGGFAYGFMKAGFNVVLGVDHCKHSLATFARNIGAEAVCLDLLERDASKRMQDALGKTRPHVVIAGPPCQGFSRAGRRKLVDARNDVILASARLAARLNPQVIVFENVRNIMVPRYEEFFRRAMHILRRNGFSVSHHLLNASHFGVPQDRERLVIVASRRHGASEIDTVLSRLAERRGGATTVAEAFDGVPRDPLRAGRKGLYNHVSMKHSRKVRLKIGRIAPGEGPLSYRKLHPDRPAATLICGHRALPCHYDVPRTITVREAARLQGFPDSFIFDGPIGSQMLQVANSVPPPFARVIGRNISRLLPIGNGRWVRREAIE